MTGILIGVGGVSRAGKSSMAQLIRQHLRRLGKSLAILSQDDYILPIDQIPIYCDQTDWESPHSIDWSKIKMDLHTLRAKYDYIILEGLFAFYDPQINCQYDKKIFIENSKSFLVKRKKIDLRWGSYPDPDWYVQHIWESYLKYGRPILDNDYKVINGAHYFDYQDIISYILQSE